MSDCGPVPHAAVTAPTSRRRSRYAKDELAERAASLALKLGVSLTMHADGSVTIHGRLDSRCPGALASEAEGDNADGALARWEASHGHTRHS